MKIRTGFVSNSSSSSYVIVTTSAAHKVAVEQMTKWQKKVIDALMSKRTLAGMEIYIGGEYCDAGCNGTIEWLSDDMGCDPEQEPPDDWDECDAEGNEPWTVQGTWEKYQELLGHANYVGTSIGDNG